MYSTPLKWTVKLKQQQQQKTTNDSSWSQKSCTKVLSNKVQTEALKCAPTPSPESFLEMRGETSEEEPCVLMPPSLFPDCITKAGCSRGKTWKEKKKKRSRRLFSAYFFFLHVCSGRQREGEGGAAGRLRGAAEQDNTEGETSNKTLQITEAPPSETLARQESDPRGKSQLYFSYMVFGCEIRGSQSLPKNKADRGGRWRVQQGGGRSKTFKVPSQYNWKSSA